MEIFTDTENHILEATDKSYKWIARDKNGELCIYKRKPFRENGEYFGTLGNLNVFNKCVSDVLFKNVTWENSPIQYRNKYSIEINSELLTPKEREYLKFVFRPFASDIMCVQKMQSNNTEYIVASIVARTCKDSMVFPYFAKGAMYKGMKLEVKYDLKELGIEYDK